MLTVALIGPDGAGKSTIAREIVRLMPLPTRYLYMGVNLEASNLMLPTTRIALAIKRRRGGRPDMMAANRPQTRGRRRGVIGGARSALRTTNWLAEEVFREIVATWFRIRGHVVVYDRLFLADYYAQDLAQADSERPVASRVHGFFLRHVYRKPELVILLDSPAAVLHARKPESSLEYLEQRRRDYRELATVVPRMEIVDVNRPLSAVVDEILALILDAARR